MHEERTGMTVLYKDIYPVERGNFAMAGDASSKIKRLLKRMDVDPVLIREVAICSYELELNLVIHSLGGELILEMTENCLTLTSSDCGPGIPNTELAMKEGYSTAPEVVRMMGFGAGMGLPNVKRHSSRLTIKSEVGKGSIITAEYDL